MLHKQRMKQQIPHTVLPVTSLMVPQRRAPVLSGHLSILSFQALISYLGSDCRSLAFHICAQVGVPPSGQRTNAPVRLSWAPSHTLGAAPTQAGHSRTSCSLKSPLLSLIWALTLSPECLQEQLHLDGLSSATISRKPNSLSGCH